MTTNVSFEYAIAEKKYLNAQTMEEKMACLEEMISAAPSHKGGENLRAELKLRLKKFKEKQEKSKKVGKSGPKGVKKEGFQAVLIGFPNSGKSSLLSKLTNAKPKISEHPFNTIQPEIGTMDYEGVRAQIVDLPAITSDSFDIGIVNTADLIIFVVENISEIDKISKMLTRAYGKRIVVINKSDLLSFEQLRKLNETIKSKKLAALQISCVSGLGILDLKEKIFQYMNVIRVYTKEPSKPVSRLPVVLPENSTVKDVAEAIRKGFSKMIIETHLTGPSSKFPNQKVGLSHILKDKDIIEFHAR